MRMASSRQAAAGSMTARETAVVEACQVLTSLVTESSDRKPVFVAEGGVIALMERLEERSTKVRITIKPSGRSSGEMHHCAALQSWLDTLTEVCVTPMRPMSEDTCNSQGLPEQLSNCFALSCVVRSMDRSGVTKLAGLQVVLAGLELANALVVGNASVMETMCLVGIVPTVARFAAPAWARGVRLQAARFVQQLCRTSLATAQMFVACQVMLLSRQATTRCMDMQMLCHA